MGLRLINIITTINNGDDIAVAHTISTLVPYCKITDFDSGFEGLIGQIDVDRVYHDCEVLGLTDKYNVSNADEAMENVFLFEEKVLEISICFPKQKFAYIDMDCFGGVCLYEGFVALGGRRIFEQEMQESGHINLLKALAPDFCGYYFEPFTREFLKENGWR